MNYSNHLSQRFLLKFYITSLFASIIGTLYVLVKPGIAVPNFPEQKLSTVLKTVGSSNLSSLTRVKNDKSSSDRKLTPIYKYSFTDGSTLLATVVRVRKRDDFKIETYGLLTKNIDSIYLKNTTVLDIRPASLLGTISTTKYVQTCIIPGTSNLEDSDFRLDKLTATIERLNPKKNSLFDKILGTKKHNDYSCLVVTYKVPPNPKDFSLKTWQNVVHSIQIALK